MKGHGAKYERKKEEAIVALLTQKNIEEAARSIGYRLGHAPALAERHGDDRDSIMQRVHVSAADGIISAPDLLDVFVRNREGLYLVHLVDENESSRASCKSPWYESLRFIRTVNSWPGGSSLIALCIFTAEALSGADLADLAQPLAVTLMADASAGLARGTNAGLFSW